MSSFRKVVHCFSEWFMGQLQWLFKMLVPGHQALNLTEADLFVCFVFFFLNPAGDSWCTLKVETHWSSGLGQRFTLGCMPLSPGNLKIKQNKTDILEDSYSLVLRWARANFKSSPHKSNTGNYPSGLSSDLYL